MNHDKKMTEPMTTVESTVTGRLKPLSLDNVNLKVLNYTPREIHAIKGHSSHPTMALISSIKEQEKFRADPRFPIMQMNRRQQRYAAIFSGPAGQPIFS